MSKLKSVLIDLSGTLHVDNEAIPGAVEALKKLRRANVGIKFVTNTTKECRRILHERLTSLGFELDVNEIWSSLWAANDLVTSQKLRPFLIIDKAAEEDFQAHLNVTSDYNAVVVGLAPEQFNYENLNTAFRILLSGARLIAIHQARYFKRSDGLALGPGMFVKGFEYSASCKAETVGKPSVDFFKAALGDIDPGSAVMIGDDVRDDIEGAQKLGMKGILVKTGKYRPGDEDKISPPPSQVFSNFSEAVEYLLQQAVESNIECKS